MVSLALAKQLLYRLERFQIMSCLLEELTRNYHRDDQLLRCTVKFDILKVYKLVEWSSFKVFAIGCPEKLFGWVETCISTPQYSIA